MALSAKTAAVDVRQRTTQACYRLGSPRVSTLVMKILAVGDMHLGRTPSRLPPQLHAPDLGPAEAWRRTVAAALNHDVKAVLLAGDVVDRDDDFFEAYRALESGVKTLADAGIAVVGVAGNHDVKVLPRLVRHIPKFRLLGEGRTMGVLPDRRRQGRGDVLGLVVSAGQGPRKPPRRQPARPGARHQPGPPALRPGRRPGFALRAGHPAGAGAHRPRRLAARSHPQAGCADRRLPERDTWAA